MFADKNEFVIHFHSQGIGMDLKVATMEELFRKWVNINTFFSMKFFVLIRSGVLS